MCEFPSSDIPSCVHSQRCCHRLRPTRINGPVAFRPRGFSPPRRLNPQQSFRACCIPVPKGVRLVSSCSLHSPPALRREPVRLVDHSLSRCALHTPRRSPPTSSRAASLRPLPSRRCASAKCSEFPRRTPRRPSTSRPCSTGGSVATASCCQPTTTLSFLGFVPLQGSGQLGTTRPDASPHRPNSTRTVDASTALPLQVTALSAPATDRRLSRRACLGHPSHRFSDSESVRSDPSAARRLRTLLGFVTSKNSADTHSEERALP